MSDAKAVVMRRIREALAAAPPDGVEVPRAYDRQPSDGFPDVERFAEAVGEYRARVHRISGGEIATTLSVLLAGYVRILVPDDVPPEWTAGMVVEYDGPGHRLSVSELDAMDVVITGCALGIATTGTIVLDAGPAQGRRALTLVPDHHACVVFTSQIVDTVPQAFAALDALRPLTFISGPSATSDIELERVEGVHGPRLLDVLIVDD